MPGRLFNFHTFHAPLNAVQPFTDTNPPPYSASMDALNHLLKDGREKRRSLSERTSSGGKTSAKNSPKLTATKPARLEVVMESPPLTSYGSVESSSGALLSGQLNLVVFESEIKLIEYEMQLLAKVTTKKPVSKDCPDCQIKVTELKKWHFLSEAGRFPKGTHSFPFSYLLPGHLPATTHGALGSIEYVLSAKATTSLHDVLTVNRSLDLLRALYPGPERTSIRIFPPTKLTATVILPQVIHPIGEITVQMRLTGICEIISNHIHRWRIRKMTWHLDEASQIVSAACPKHGHKLGGEGKGLKHNDTRVVGDGECKGGWKTDFETPGGCIELEFPVALKPALRPVCDVKTPTGFEATHALVVELIVAEELASPKSPKHGSPTGSARVLRMQFAVVVTERSGLGISWDEEQPPMYDDVPASPPGYARMDDYVGEELSGEEYHLT